MKEDDANDALRVKWPDGNNWKSMETDFWKRITNKSYIQITMGTFMNKISLKMALASMCDQLRNSSQGNQGSPCWACGFMERKTLTSHNFPGCTGNQWLLQDGVCC